MSEEKDVELTIEKNGFNGVFHEGNKNSDAVIIRVAGSGAPKEKVISCSKFLYDVGYNVLCLGFYMWGDLGNDVNEIPLDYVEKAIAWIKEYMKNPNIRIGMTGLSQGASYTLAAAARIPEITSIVVVSPYDYVMEGYTSTLKRTHHSSYTYHGEELPYTEWRILKECLPKLFFKIVRDKAYGISRMMRYIFDKNGIDETSIIEVEKIHADILLLASKDDDCWPSDEAVPRIVERLRAIEYPFKVESYIYEKGCHNMGGNMTMDGRTGRKMRMLMKSWSDHPEECKKCIVDSRKRILDFFEKTLK